MVKETWANASPASCESVVSYATEPVTKMVVNDAVVEVKSYEAPSNSAAGQSNPWGEYVSKEHFVDMHFC
jgi:hypothetical protein